MNTSALPSSLPAPLRALPALLLKSGVALGGLSAAERNLALAVAWAGLPCSEMTEPAVNEALHARLAGACAFVDTDHVELRRWLVDVGWLARDGWGRAYRRVERDALRPALQPLANALEGVDADRLATELRAADDARRAARRQAWESRQAAG